jgi:hypothetical protein
LRPLPIQSSPILLLHLIKLWALYSSGCRSRGVGLPVRQLSELSELAFSHSFGSRDVAWIHLAYALTKRDDVGTTSPTVLTR